jgi:5'-deoxynucleotidase YfbR-like HD superfamily hydrolase
MDAGKILVSSGRLIDLARISPNDICIKDIAHALSNLCRFGGHSHKFYSVAQHSVRVSKLLPKEYKLLGLLHDATEAYLVDVPRPVRQLLPAYDVLEKRVWQAIALHYKLPLELQLIVKQADDAVLAAEFEELMPPYNTIDFSGSFTVDRASYAETPSEARCFFYQAFCEYSK